MRKESSSNNKYFFTLTFSCRRIYILLENIFGKTQFILLHLYYIFFVWQVIRSVVIKHQRPYRYALVFRRSISTQNTWQQTRYFKVYFESNGLIFLFHIYIYLIEVPSIQKKTKSFAQVNFWFNPYKKPDILTVELFFKLCTYLKDMYITLKGIRRILFVCIKNFANH